MITKAGYNKFSVLVIRIRTSTYYLYRLIEQKQYYNLVRFLNYAKSDIFQFRNIITTSSPLFGSIALIPVRQARSQRLQKYNNEVFEIEEQSLKSYYKFITECKTTMLETIAIETLKMKTKTRRLIREVRSPILHRNKAKRYALRTTIHNKTFQTDLRVLARHGE